MTLAHRFAIEDAFAGILDDLHVAAVMEHRRAIRRPLTAHAAKLLAAQFARCFNPNEAADEMILRGWQGFKPEWVRDRDMTRPPSAHARQSVGNPMIDALARMQ